MVIEAIPMAGLDQLIDRASRSLMDTYGRYPVALQSGRGAIVVDSEGRELIDCLAGVAVNILGHGHPAVVDSLRSQAATFIHASNLYYTEPQVELAELLVEKAFSGRVFLCNSGTEANECAIKLARAWGKRQKHGAFRIACLDHGFAGRTMGSLAATSKPAFREPFTPMLDGFDNVPPGDIDALAAAVDGNTAAVFVEPIQGESGVLPLADTYLQDVRTLCDERDVLLILDEVQTGMGRTGRWWAHLHAGITPDVMTLAKGLGGGIPIGAVLASPKADVFVRGDHGSTFGGNPLAATVAAAVIRAVEAEQLVDRAARVGEHLRQRLVGMAARSGGVHLIRGRGLMLGVVLERPIAQGVVIEAIRTGVLVNATDTHTLRLVPPLVLSEAQADEAVLRLERAIAAAAA